MAIVPFVKIRPIFANAAMAGAMHVSVIMDVVPIMGGTAGGGYNK